MVYGPSNGQPIDEQHEAAPMSPYGASKLACEQLLAYQAATGALGAISLRVFAAAGAVGRLGDRDLGRLIPKALAVARGQAPYFEVNSDGSAVREFTHVADVAEAYLQALEATKPGSTRSTTSARAAQSPSERSLPWSRRSPAVPSRCAIGQPSRSRPRSSLTTAELVTCLGGSQLDPRFGRSSRMRGRPR